MKFMEKLKKAKKDNKGFSLVELIIVIAIMAILVGIVGTQVIPYINKSKEAKDFQIINSYSTAAMTAYASHAEDVEAEFAASSPTEVSTVTDPDDNTKSYKVITFNVYASDTTKIKKELEQEIISLTYASKTDLKEKFGSTNGKKIDDIKITINYEKKTITTQAVDATGAEVFDAIVSQM